MLTGDCSAPSAAIAEGAVRQNKGSELRSLHRPAGGRAAGGRVFLQDPRSIASMIPCVICEPVVCRDFLVTRLCSVIACDTGQTVLTLWCPLLPYGHSYKASCARLAEAVIVIFDIGHSDTQPWARMSKIKNDSLTRSGTRCFIAVPTWQQWVSMGLKCTFMQFIFICWLLLSFTGPVDAA